MIEPVHLETPACFSARLTARPGARPVCRSDGTYAPVQCHEETGYCWCVTPQGRPLPDTSVRNERPRCVKKPGPRSTASTRSGQRRRSPNWKQRRQYSSKHRNTCDRAEKSKFNGNLIENFKIEYRRTNISADGEDSRRNIVTRISAHRREGRWKDFRKYLSDSFRFWSLSYLKRNMKLQSAEFLKIYTRRVYIFFLRRTRMSNCYLNRKETLSHSAR